MSILKKCDKCGLEKEPAQFYRRHDTCRKCVMEASGMVRQPLEAQVEQRRQEKMLRKELRKIAFERLRSKKKARQVRKRAALELAPPENASAEPVLEGVDDATQELARRELQRRRLIEFIKAFHPRYKAGWVHYDICQRLEKFSADVEAGKSPRLIILMPPRHGKSQIASKMYPSWHLGHYPHHEFIGCSYNISLALEFSRDVRNIIRTDTYDKLFPGTKLSSEVQSAESWKLASPGVVGAGGYVAAGIGGGITGKGAHILVIDDPIKNDEEANSIDIRQKIWSWYTSSAYTRLAPGGGILIIQTCWHDDDLAGRIQLMMRENADDEYVDQFEIVKYPAIAEEDEEYRLKGEALHPERFDLPKLLRIQRQMGGAQSYQWSSLYQQSPIPTEGAYFSMNMLQYRDETPSVDAMDIYQAWDTAISEEQAKWGNWTVGVTIGLDHQDMAHVLERRRFKTNDSAVIENAIIDMYSNYKRVAAVGFEDGQIFKTMRSSLKRRMVERKVYIPLDDKENVLKPISDKMVRARPLQARLQNKKVTFPRGCTWVDEMWKEFIRFPAGVQDDQVDATAWCTQLLLGKSPPQPPRPAYKKVELTVAQQLAKHARVGAGGGHMAG
jgi:predicted phage terminase large subunit-like protein